MKIKELILQSKNPTALCTFYKDTLGLFSEIQSEDLHVYAGNTKLIFKKSHTSNPYHFAFNIPENQFAEAKSWLSKRVKLIVDKDGDSEFNFTDWNAHSIYAYDSDNNILELIARHNLKNANHTEFSAKSILSVSEIGIATKDVLTLSQEMQGQFGLAIYSGKESNSFKALGDENGLFIIVSENRLWFPDTEIAALHLPTKVIFENNENKVFSFSC